MRTLLKAALLCALCSPATLSFAARSSPSGEMEAKLELEGSIERRLESVLRKALDSENIIVIVNVETETASKKEKAEEESKEDILPGVPPKFTPGVPSAGPLAVMLTTVKNVSVAVLIEDSLTDADVKFVKEKAAHLLGTYPEQIAVEKIKFRKPPPASPADYFKQPSRLLELLWLIVVLGAIVVIYQGALKPFIGVLREWSQARQAAAAAADKRPENEALETVRPEAAAAAEDWTESRADYPFAFLQPRDIPALNLLLQKARPLTAAVVIHYLPPNLASEALQALAPDIRRKIVTFMSKVTQLDQSQVKAVEDSIRSRINYLMGGEHKLAELLGHAPAGLQRELLQALGEQNPTLGERLRRRIVLVEDLGLLNEAELKILMRRVPLRSLAVVLKSHPEVKDAMLPKVTTGVGEWLSQEIDLTGLMPTEAVETEQRRVLEALSQLVREGRINLHKEETPPLSSPAAGQSAAGTAVKEHNLPTAPLQGGVLGESADPSPQKPKEK
jgi:flagellar motor switch protein FliG